jgi:hypothetical protein
MGFLMLPSNIHVLKLKGALPFIVSAICHQESATGVMVSRGSWSARQLPKGHSRWCEQHFPYFIPAADYPSRSLELNAMEHIWSWMQTRVEAARLASRRELDRYLVMLWNDVPPQVVRNCMAAISERLLVAAKGSQILSK